jgi:chromosome segregation ATPase
MIKSKNLALVLFITFIFSLGFILSSCSSEATVEQLQKIKDLEAEASSLEQSIKTKEGEKAKVEGELNVLDSKLKDCEKEKELVKQRLSTWKEPVQPQPVEEQTPKKDKKKKTR